jgi:AraC family transcriptional regulator
VLRYFANGRVRWKNRMRCNTRTNWEIYAVIDGRCGLSFSDQRAPRFAEHTLWIFAPECSHAWANAGKTDYHRIALHFGSVPYPVDEIARRHGGWLERKLATADLTKLRRLAAQIEPHFCRPTLLSPIVFQRALMELSLQLVEDNEGAMLPPALTDLANFKIERALSWYAEHLASAPSVKQVADAIHVSPSHLRRLFWQGRRESPKTQFQRIRLEKAKELMSRSAFTLEEIARHCGYASASHLCREHKAAYNFTPTTWRKKLIDRFVRPLPAGEVPVREFSARPEERVMRA